MNVTLPVNKENDLTLRYYFVDHFHNYQHHEIDKQLNVHNELAQVLTQLWYNAHPNGKDNKLMIVFHPMKSRFHHTKRDTI